MKLWIIDTTIPFNKINSEWEIIYPVIANQLKEVIPVRYIRSNYQVSDNGNYHSVNYLSDLTQILRSQFRSIRTRDIIVFTDARNPVTILLHEYFLLSKIRPYCIGIWIDGLFNSQGLFYTAYKNRERTIGNSYERLLRDIYDINIVTWDRNFNALKGKDVRFTRLPFDLIEEGYKFRNFSIPDKTDDILYYSDTSRNFSEDSLKLYFKSVIQANPSWNFVDMSKHAVSNWQAVYPTVAASKCMLQLRRQVLNPYDLFHGAVLGLATIIPKTYHMSQIKYPEELMFNYHLLKGKFLNFIRSRVIQDKIKFCLDNHTEAIQLIKDNTAHLYNHDEFISLIIKVVKKLKK